MLLRLSQPPLIEEGYDVRPQGNSGGMRDHCGGVRDHVEV